MISWLRLGTKELSLLSLGLMVGAALRSTSVKSTRLTKMTSGTKNLLKLLANPDIFEVQRDVGTKKVGGGVRTRSKTSRTKKEEVKPKAKPKKGKGLRKPKGKSK